MHNVFLAWSGPQSHAVALTLRGWLPKVAPGLEPWLSTTDIRKGREWFQEIHAAADDVRAIVTTLTPDNIRSPWPYYECGVVAARKPDTRVCPFLVGVSASMLADGPLHPFQATTAEPKDTARLVRSLVEVALASHRTEVEITERVREHWPELDAALRPILDAEPDDDEGFIETDADRLAGFQLTPEARTMIVEVSKDRNGILLFFRTSSGTEFATNGKNLCPDQTARTIARWRGAVDDLVDHDMFDVCGDRGESFRLTREGYDLADILRPAMPNP